VTRSKYAVLYWKAWGMPIECAARPDLHAGRKRSATQQKPSRKIAVRDPFNGTSARPISNKPDSILNGQIAGRLSARWEVQMDIPRFRSWYSCLGLALLASIASARPLLLPPAQRLVIPSPGGTGFQHQPIIHRVAIDGPTAMVAAERAIDSSNNRAIGVYVFERDAAGQWNYRGPLTESPALTGGAPIIEGNLAAVSGRTASGDPAVTVYERGASGWALSGVIELPQNGVAFQISDAAIYVQFYNSFYPSCEAPLRQYRRVAGVWQHTATIGPERCAYTRADVSQGRVVIGYEAGSEPDLLPVEIYADNGSASWPRVATLQPPPRTTWPFMNGLGVTIEGNTLYSENGYLFRDAGSNNWVRSGLLIEPEVETNLRSTLSDPPRLRGQFLVLPGVEKDYEPPVVQDSGSDLIYSWETLRVYRQRSDGGFDYYAKLNPENGIGTFGVSSDGRRIIVSSSDSSFQTGEYQQVYVFEVPASVSFPGTLQDDFEAGAGGRWTSSAGSFNIAQTGITRVLRQSSTLGEAGAMYDVDWTDQAIEADIRPIQFAGPDRWFGLVARRIDDRNYYYVTFRSTGDTIIKRMRDGVFTNIAVNWGEPFVAGRNYRVRFEAVGDQLAAFVNGKGVTHGKDSTFNRGRPGVAGYKASFDVDNVILSGGTRTLLRADGPVNSFTHVPAPGRTGTWNYLELPDYQLAFRQSSLAGDARWVSRVATGNLVVSARVRPLDFGTSSSGQDQWVGIAARYLDDSNYYYLTLRNSNRVSLRKLVNGTIQELGSATVAVTTGAWYDLRVEIIGSRIRAFVDGELKVQLTDPAAIGSGRNAMIMYKATADYTDYFVYQP
jgi:hypothetical protein